MFPSGMPTRSRSPASDDEVESVWQRVREWADRAKRERRPVETLQRGTVNLIKEVSERTIARESEGGKTNRSRVGRAQVARVWQALRADGETRMPKGVLYFTGALMVAALPGVIEHAGDGLLRLVRDEGGRRRATARAPTFIPGADVLSGPVERMHVEEFEVRTKAQSRRCKRREGQLVRAYLRHIEGRAVAGSKRYPPSGVRCDVFIEDRAQLIEAKPDTTRSSIRMAIGQLMDYRHLGKYGNVELAILVPERPPKDLETLLDSLQIACVWKAGGGFEDNRTGKFC